MRVLSLFSGIGGLDLGLESAVPGAHVVAQVEINAYCRGVLARHWPDADRRITDVRLAHRLYATPAGTTFVAGALPGVDLVCGGFPCQDISTAGKGAGLDGERSGLWWQVWRLVRDLRPRFVVLENVGALVVRGIDAVLGALAALGYDAEWAVFGASDVGAPHRRRRVAIIAYLPDADADGREGLAACGAGSGLERGGNADGRGAGEDQGWTGFRVRPWDGRPTQSGLGRAADGPPPRLDVAPWEAGVDRTAESQPTTTPRLAACGNAVVPQWAYAVGLRVLALTRAGA